MLLLLVGAAHADPIGYRTNGLRLRSSWGSAHDAVCNLFEPCIYLNSDGHIHFADSAGNDHDLVATTLSSLTLSVPLGTLLVAPTHVSSTDLNPVLFTATDPLSTHWHEWLSQFNAGCAGGGSHNFVHRFGWNGNGGGDRELTGTNQSMFEDTLEQAYVGSLGPCQMERYFEYRDTNGTLVRPLFWAGDTTDATNTKFDFRAASIAMGPGLNVGDPSGLSISTTETGVFSPDQFKRLRVNNSSLLAEAGSTNSPTAFMQLDATGDMGLRAVRGFVGPNGSTTLLSWQSGFVQLTSASQNDFITVSTNDIQIGVGGARNLRPQPGYTLVYVPLQPVNDSTASIGAPSARFTLGYFGAASTSQPSCDSTTRGGLMPIFAGAGVADTFQICRKNSDDSYSWHTVTVP